VSPNANVLQLSVGTANIYGTTGLNVVETYRQPKGGTHPGDSGALVNSPSLAVPAGSIVAAAGSAGGPDGLSTIITGPTTAEITANTMTSTSQSTSASTATTFGQSGGAYGIGLEPFNNTVLTGDVPWTVVPYPVPVYDGSGDPNQIPAAWGGPPAFDLLGNGTSPVGSGIVPAGTAGVSEGLNVFAGVNPVANSPYALTVAINGTSSGSFTKTATAQMTSTALLPAITPPTFTPDGSGGGTFALTFPAGVTEAYIEVYDLGTDTTGAVSCNGASPTTPIIYTLEGTPATGFPALGDAAGPGATPSVCTAAQNAAANGGTATDSDVIAFDAIGFDYPMYEASYPNSLGNPAPTITGASGQSDITISPAAVAGGAAGGTSTRRGFPKLTVQRRHLH